MAQVVIDILKSKGGHLPLSEIYEDFWERYARISPKKDFYSECTKHGELRYHHIVRAVLHQLKNKRVVNNPQRGIWTLET